MKIKKMLSLENFINILSIILLSSISAYAFIYLFISKDYTIENVKISGNKFLEKNNITSLISENIKNKNIYNIHVKELNNKIMSHEFIKTSKIWSLF